MTSEKPPLSVRKCLAVTLRAFIVRIFRSVSRFEFYTVQAKLCPIFCIAGIQGKPQGDCRRAENIALVNRYLGESRYILRKKSAVGPDFRKSLTDRKFLTIKLVERRKLREE